jgi:predicted aspartyl protease
LPGYNWLVRSVARPDHCIVQGVETMETKVMGRVLTEATLENLNDVLNAENGVLPLERVRRYTVPDALVDTGATMLSLPANLIKKLGLQKYSRRRVRSTTGVAEADLYAAVRLTIQGRICTMDVMEVPDDTPVLIGQLPLEQLDFVVDLQSRMLIGNPAHGGEQMYELY